MVLSPLFLASPLAHMSVQDRKIVLDLAVVGRFDLYLAVVHKQVAPLEVEVAALRFAES